ncbi:D-alanyl-D-alanine carboxypeptidase family protein [Alkalibacillus silvisoli]|uniref:D-alanyl-D-alanine carboxypeptidase DacB n=1 Tax=Alkalibacillus silvisoli TaxID=392823 RepID=A0ABN0ZZZ0_9BACI
MNINRSLKKKIPIIIVLALFIAVFGFLTKINAHEQDLLLNSESVILIDQTSGDILYQKNSSKQMYPASITKIISGILAIEDGDLNEDVTISQEATEVIGTSVYLLEEEEVPLRDLVKGMLINSGNDASYAIAEHLAGGEEAFAEKMNELVQEDIGVDNTNFVNPHGLFDEEQYTTAEDMARITQYAMENETFKDIVGMNEYEWESEGWETTIHNHHQLVRQHDEITGVKNGYVQKSGYTLVTTASHEDEQIDLVAVTLDSPSANHAYSDTEALINYGFENYETNEIQRGELIEDHDGQEYKVEENLYFTTEVDEDWTTQVDENGELKIKNEDDLVILEKPLRTVAEIEGEGDPKESQIAMGASELPNEDDSYTFLLISLIILTILALFTTFTVRKRRKRDRFFR